MFARFRKLHFTAKCLNTSSFVAHYIAAQYNELTDDALMSSEILNKCLVAKILIIVRFLVGREHQRPPENLAEILARFLVRLFKIYFSS